MSPVEVSLKTPVNYQGTTYEKLSFRVPILADVRALKMMGDEKTNAEAFDHVMQYAQRLCTTIDSKAFGQVTVEDSMAIAKAIAPLFGVPPVAESD
ncbi:phage tail assembly protein [Mesosutterella sp. AGMB02718]|uniref:Phage tail assembly protein n=1 Tax=Mesosutterella faecium TaxID=2925194 RepID=A0ABT7ILW3_9BURK|nr:phage tail assembly protein [Mesosutterella sp. AGMB02718]MDL2058356.1 phage tail assembly protein [Mesosutterella sp. AGMB02718]MDL2060592.1 phage tail assembly protein [Mesosutterella sp. AGMB02718]